MARSKRRHLVGRHAEVVVAPHHEREQRALVVDGRRTRAAARAAARSPGTRWWIARGTAARSPSTCAGATCADTWPVAVVADAGVGGVDLVAPAVPVAQRLQRHRRHAALGARRRTCPRAPTGSGRRRRSCRPCAWPRRATARRVARSAGTPGRRPRAPRAGRRRVRRGTPTPARSAPGCARTAGGPEAAPAAPGAGRRHQLAPAVGAERPAVVRALEQAVGDDAERERRLPVRAAVGRGGDLARRAPRHTTRSSPQTRTPSGRSPVTSLGAGDGVPRVAEPGLADEGGHDPSLPHRSWSDHQTVRASVRGMSSPNTLIFVDFPTTDAAAAARFYRRGVRLGGRTPPGGRLLPHRPGRSLPRRRRNAVRRRQPAHGHLRDGARRPRPPPGARAPGCAGRSRTPHLHPRRRRRQRGGHPRPGRGARRHRAVA